MTAAPVKAPKTASLVAGAGWTYFVFVTNRAVTFISSILLARLLPPGDFGLMAAALLALSYLDTIKDAGIGAALVREKREIEKAAKVAFLISIGFGLGLTALLFVASPYVARFFNEPRLDLILKVLSPTLLLGSLNSVQSYWQQRNFNFRRRTLPETIRTISKAIVSIGLAMAGFGVWSLIFGQLASQIAAILGYLKASELKLRLAFERNIALRLLGYGIPLAIVTLTGVLSKTVDQLMTGKLLSAASLGYYYLAASVPELVVMSLCTTASQVLYPAYSHARESRRLLRHSYLASTRFVTALTTPIAAGLAICAHDFVQIVYSERWLPSAAAMQLLAVNSLVISVAFNAGDVFKAVGKANLLTKLSIAGIAIAVPLMVLMSRADIAGIAFSQLVASTIVAATTIVLICREVEMPLRRWILTVMPTASSVFAMVLVCAGVGQLLASFLPVWRLPTVVLSGALTYSAFTWLLNRKLVVSMWREWKRRGRRRAVVART